MVHEALTTGIPGCEGSKRPLLSFGCTPKGIVSTDRKALGRRHALISECLTGRVAGIPTRSGAPRDTSIALRDRQRAPNDLLALMRSSRSECSGPSPRYAHRALGASCSRGTIWCRVAVALAAMVVLGASIITGDVIDSRRFEHDVLRAVIQHVAPHLLQPFPALDDLEKMISGELTDFASEE